MINLKYIITGTGRCGTLFTANYLTSAGIPCSHEAIFNYKGIEYAKDVINQKKELISSDISKNEILLKDKNIEAESSYMSAPFLKEFDCLVIHLIRNPVQVINSFLTLDYFSNSNNPNNINYEKFIYSHLPILEWDMPQLDRACLYWAEWNELIAKSNKINFIHKIENPMDEVSNFINSKGNYNKEKCNTLNYKYKKCKLSDVKNENIKKIFLKVAKKYKYNVIF